MKHYVLHDSDGTIHRTLTQTEEITEATLHGFTVLEDTSLTAHYTSHYVQQNTVLAKTPVTLTAPTTVIADGTTEYSITGLPNPCNVTWPDGAVTIVTDGVITFDIDLEGEYTFKFNSIPHIIEDVTIEAIPSP